MTTTDITHRRAATPMINQMAVATLHLEHLADTADPPKAETAARVNGISPEQQRSFVLDTADRIRTALDKITTLYETPAPPAHHDHGRDLHPPTCCRPTDPNTAIVATYPTTAAAYAVLIGDRNDAQRIVAAMLPDERAAFAGHLNELRTLLGLVCDNCGCQVELGSAMTDPFAARCRFLCIDCAAPLQRRSPHPVHSKPDADG